MFYTLILENETGQKIDLSKTANRLQKIGGTANIRLGKTDNEQYKMIFELSQGTGRSILQFVEDFVTVEHHRFGIRQNKIQLVGMIESFDRNGRNLTPTFKEE